MATAPYTMPHAMPLRAAQGGDIPGTGPARVLVSLFNGFRWALEMRRRCDLLTSGGKPLDGDAVRRIMDEVDARYPLR